MAIVLDERQFRSAATQWSAAANRTYAEGVDKMLINIGFASQRYAPVASKDAIAGLKGEHKLIAWLARRKYGTAPRVQRMYGKDILGTTKKGNVSRRKSRRRTRATAVSYTIEEAREIEKRYIKARKSAHKFILNSFKVWTAAMKGVAPAGRGKLLAGRVNGGRAGSKTHRTNPKGTGFDVRYNGRRGLRNFTRAAEVSLSFNFRRAKTSPPSGHANATERIWQKTVNRAMPWAIRDTMKYVERKVAKSAKRFSA